MTSPTSLIHLTGLLTGSVTWIKNTDKSDFGLKVRIMYISRYRMSIFIIYIYHECFLNTSFFVLVRPNQSILFFFLMFNFLSSGQFI